MSAKQSVSNTSIMLCHNLLPSNPKSGPARHLTTQVELHPFDSRRLATAAMAAERRKLFVVGCSIEHVLMHFLTVTEDRMSWLHFTFDVSVILPRNVVCTDRFRKESFENYQQYMAVFTKRLGQKEDFLPTVCHTYGDDGVVSI